MLRLRQRKGKNYFTKADSYNHKLSIINNKFSDEHESVNNEIRGHPRL